MLFLNIDLVLYTEVFVFIMIIMFIYYILNINN